MISIDRCGFGLSNYGNSMVSIRSQADILFGLIQELEFASIALVGYYYGGLIAGLLASYEEVPVNKLLLISALTLYTKSRMMGDYHVRFCERYR